jgi:hypothetical protein
MGQYWVPVNLDKHEFIHPHKLGAGLKIGEQVGTHPGTGIALLILTTAQPEARGGGDLDMDENWHGPERTFPTYNATPGPMPETYPAIAARTIGRWAGDRIAIVGDYAKNGDLAPRFKAKDIWKQCLGDTPTWTDVTEDVCRVIEHELQGKFSGTGWRRFTFDGEEEPASHALKPDIGIATNGR